MYDTTQGGIDLSGFVFDVCSVNLVTNLFSYPSYYITTSTIVVVVVFEQVYQSFSALHKRINIHSACTF